MTPADPPARPDEGRERQHCWHVGGPGTSTCMVGLNSGSQWSRCCHCGTERNRQWSQSYAKIPGHGDKYEQIVTVYDSDADACPGPTDPTPLPGASKDTR